ncbi:MAG: HEPN domain-containing protein [Ignavibacteriales bacterium]
MRKQLANGFLSTAMNSIYYAGFYIVSALAALDNFSTAKHKQLIGYFNKEYINSGRIDPEIGKILRTAYDRRQAADYHDFVTLTKLDRVRKIPLIWPKLAVSGSR